MFHAGQPVESQSLQTLLELDEFRVGEGLFLSR